MIRSDSFFISSSWAYVKHDHPIPKKKKKNVYEFYVDSTGDEKGIVLVSPPDITALADWA